MAEVRLYIVPSRQTPAIRAKTTFNITTMLAIPIDVLREILEHVRTADLATLRRVNKVFCSCSQHVLYRDIYYPSKRVTLTLSRSTVLARRVRSFQHYLSCPELATALRNMSSLRRLNLWFNIWNDCDVSF